MFFRPLQRRCKMFPVLCCQIGCSGCSTGLRAGAETVPVWSWICSTGFNSGAETVPQGWGLGQRLFLRIEIWGWDCFTGLRSGAETVAEGRALELRSGRRLTALPVSTLSLMHHGSHGQAPASLSPSQSNWWPLTLTHMGELRATEWSEQDRQGKAGAERLNRASMRPPCPAALCIILH